MNEMYYIEIFTAILLGDIIALVIVWQLKPVKKT